MNAERNPDQPPDLSALVALIANAADEDALALLSELQARFERNKARGAERFSAEEDATWTAVTEAYTEQAFGVDSRRKVQPLPMFVKAYGRGRFQETSLILTDVINAGIASIKDPLRRPERREIERLLLRALVNWMVGRRIVVTPKTICEQMPNIRHAFEAAYPGYFGAGMLHALVRIKRAA